MKKTGTFKYDLKGSIKSNVHKMSQFTKIRNMPEKCPFPF